jgi:predicted nucleic acid-binding protein
MRLIADTNVIFSSLLKMNSIELSILESERFEVYIPTFTFLEIFKHKERIINFSKLTENEILEAYSLILKYTNIINEKDIPKDLMKYSYIKCKDVDENDTIFVASSLFLEGYLWTNDKKLRDGLAKRGLSNIINTIELIKLIN